VKPYWQTVKPNAYLIKDLKNHMVGVYNARIIRPYRKARYVEDDGELNEDNTSERKDYEQGKENHVAREDLDDDDEESLIDEEDVDIARVNAMTMEPSEEELITENEEESSGDLETNRRRISQNKGGNIYR